MIAKPLASLGILALGATLAGAAGAAPPNPFGPSSGLEALRLAAEHTVKPDKAAQKQPAGLSDRSTTKAAAGGEKTRDWAAMDTNKDHSISPEEMTRWMAENRVAPTK
jgi:hypothetical protein